MVLLADVFENFLNICMKPYDIDPAHYYTAPGLSYDAALKISGIQQDLLIDPYMPFMIEKRIRCWGSLTMVAERNARANNPT